MLAPQVGGGDSEKAQLPLLNRVILNRYRTEKYFLPEESYIILFVKVPYFILFVRRLFEKVPYFILIVRRLFEKVPYFILIVRRLFKKVP